MAKPTDIRPIGVRLYFLPVQTRVPLKFGPETLTHVTCARVCVKVVNQKGETAEGWGETPLSVQWVWPEQTPYEERHQALKQFTIALAERWATAKLSGHPIEIGHDFQQTLLPQCLTAFNQRRCEPAPSREANSRSVWSAAPSAAFRRRGAKAVEAPRTKSGGMRRAPNASRGSSGVEASPKSPLPWLPALACCSPFDLALHDAFGQLLRRPTYETYGREFMNRDLAHYLEAAPRARAEFRTGSAKAGTTNQPAPRSGADFRGKYPADFLAPRPAEKLLAWHLVAGLDPLAASHLTGAEPHDGYPLLLADWVKADGLKCLKVKLRGNDRDWDLQRLVDVGSIAIAHDVIWLSADFNCTVSDPDYVNEILDHLRDDHPRLYGMVLYVEQPFPYDLEQNLMDVHSVSARKPLFLDESAHDWRIVRLGRELGWSGVALKTCKTQTGAVLSGCWSKAHGMSLMVQDLTNPMLAQIPHLLLAAHAGTIMGVETNAMQFYPEASRPEAEVHPGCYRRAGGFVSLTSLDGPGFGYRIEEIKRELPVPAAKFC